MNISHIFQIQAPGFPFGAEARLREAAEALCDALTALEGASDDAFGHASVGFEGRTRRTVEAGYADALARLAEIRAGLRRQIRDLEDARARAVGADAHESPRRWPVP